jgi:hypothetical protein
MESETKEPRNLRLDKSLELLEWLMNRRLTLREASIVLGCVEDGMSLSQGLLMVFVSQDEKKEKSDGKIPSPLFNDPIAF